MREEEYMLAQEPATINTPYIIEESHDLLPDEDPTCDAEPKAELTEERSESEGDENIAEDEEDPMLTPSIELHENADFVLECSCGHTEIIAKDVTGGMQYFVRALPGDALDIQCKACLHKFKLYFREKPAIEEESNNEQVSEDNKE